MSERNDALEEAARLIEAGAANTKHPVILELVTAQAASIRRLKSEAPLTENQALSTPRGML